MGEAGRPGKARKGEAGGKQGQAGWLGDTKPALFGLSDPEPIGELEKLQALPDDALGREWPEGVKQGAALRCAVPCQEELRATGYNTISPPPSPRHPVAQRPEPRHPSTHHPAATAAAAAAAAAASYPVTATSPGHRVKEVARTGKPIGACPGGERERRAVSRGRAGIAGQDRESRKHRAAQASTRGRQACPCEQRQPRLHAPMGPRSGRVKWPWKVCEGGGRGHGVSLQQRQGIVLPRD